MKICAHIILAFLAVTQSLAAQDLNFKKIEIDTNYSFRGLSVVDDSVAWVSGIKGVVGKSTNGGIKWTFTQVKGFEKWDFRSLYAFNSNEAVIANAGSPAHILRTNDGGKNWDILYTQTKIHWHFLMEWISGMTKKELSTEIRSKAGCYC